MLPGDWGFFSSYLIGGITLAVLAVGSTSPGLLQFAIDKFSQARARMLMGCICCVWRCWEPGCSGLLQCRRRQAFAAARVSLRRRAVLLVTVCCITCSIGVAMPGSTSSCPAAARRRLTQSTNPITARDGTEAAACLGPQVFPDYRARVVSHEAAHFLAGYLLGVPVAGYSLMIGQVGIFLYCVRAMHVHAIMVDVKSWSSRWVVVRCDTLCCLLVLPAHTSMLAVQSLVIARVLSSEF